MKYAAILLLCGVAWGQTQTTCTTNGNNTTCNSQPNSYEAGRQAGAGIANLAIAIGRRSENRTVTKFCYDNPGQIYRGIQCPTEEDQAVAAASTFINKYPEFKQSDDNGRKLLSYMVANNMNLRDPKSYAHAFKVLKKKGSVELNKVE